MSTPADLSRPLPTAATEAREEKLVESKGVEPLPESTPGPDGAGEPGAAEGAPSAPAPAKSIARPQTVLEAAKAIDSFFGTASLYACSDLVQNLRDAIYREESRPPNAEELALAEVAKARWQFSIPDGQTVVQALWARRKGKEQAEAELARVRKEILAPALSLLGAGPNETLVEAVKRTLHGISGINGIHLAAGARPGVDDVTAKVLELRQRAEKAEADLAAERAKMPRPEHVPSWRARATEAEREVEDLREQVDRIRDQLRADASTPAVDAAKKMRKRLEKAEADLAKEREVSSRLASRAADTIAIDTSGHWEGRAKKLEEELAQARIHLRRVAHAADVALSYSGAPCSQARESLQRTASEARRMVLDRVDSELSANAKWQHEVAKADAEALKRLSAPPEVLDGLPKVPGAVPGLPRYVRVREIPGGFEICVTEGRCDRCGAYVILDVVRGRLRWMEPKRPRRGGGW